MTFHEKDFQTKFSLWAKHNINESCAIELKICKGTSLPFSNLADHQRENLEAAYHRKMVWKIPDCGYQNPFDMFVLSEAKAYVAVMFYHKGQKEFFLIDIVSWCNEETSGQRKSLTEDRARAIGKTCTLA